MTPWALNPQWVEGDLYFDFSAAQSAFKLDSKEHGLSHFFKAVDYVVEWTNQLWLIEIKDPENGNIPPEHQPSQQASFRKELVSGQLIDKHLFPKFRDSLLYLGMNRGIADLPLKYLTLIGLETVPVAELEGLTHALRHTQWLNGPARGWQKPFDLHCLNLTQWNHNLSDKCPVTRISHANQ